MKSRTPRLILALALAPGLLHPQAFKPKAEIRLFEQPSGFVLGASDRVYTYYFNTNRTRWISVEVTLDYPAAASTFKYSIGCQMTRPDGRVVDGVWRIGVDVLAKSTHAVGANYLFGAGKEGWQTGIHKVTCSADQPLGESSFQMSPGPSLLSSAELRLKDVRFFPTGPQVTAATRRNYLDRFSAAEATRIGIELSFLHPGLTQSGEVPIDCYFLTPGGKVLGTLSGSYKMDPPAIAGSLGMGIGWDEPGHWDKGEYLAICQIHGRPISIDRFTVW